MSQTGVDDAGRHIALRGGPAAEWTADNPILRVRELGVETDTGTAKLGDGVTHWNDLDYVFGQGGGGGPSGEVRAAWSSPYSYIGTAPAGTLDSAEGWTIARIEVESDGSDTTLHALNATWDDRASETYS